MRTNDYPAKPFTARCSLATQNNQVAQCYASIPTGETFVVQSLSLTCERSTAAPVRPDVQSDDASGHSVYLSLVPGPDTGYGNSWWDTSAQLSGTEYLKTTMLFQCVGTNSTGYELSATGTAQGYLYP